MVEPGEDSASYLASSRLSAGLAAMRAIMERDLPVRSFSLPEKVIHKSHSETA